MLKNKKRVSERFRYTIKELREQRGMSQSELAKRSEMTTTYISRLESGSRACPSYPFIASLASGLEVSVDMLLEVAYEYDVEDELLIIVVDKDRGLEFKSVIVVENKGELVKLIGEIMEKNNEGKTYKIFIIHIGDNSYA